MASVKKDGSQLVELFEKASKSADKVEDDETNEAEETRCIDALKAMRAVSVTTSMLMDTQYYPTAENSGSYRGPACQLQPVAKRLRRLTKHKSSEISSVAQEIINAWRKVVAAEAAAKNDAAKSEPTSSNKSSVTSKDSLKSPRSGDTPKSPTTIIKSEKLTAVKKETTVKVEMKTSSVSVSKTSSNTTVSSTTSTNGSTGNFKLPKTGDSTRDRIRELLAEAFSKVLTEAQDDLLQKAKMKDIVHVAVTVESAMFKKLGLSKDANKTKYRSIMFNLKDANNPDLRRRVLLGEIEPEQLMTMSVDDMASDQRKAENKKIKDKALFECERGLKAAASTDQFKCGKCKQRKCTYFQMQTRSADEPMTTFVTCVNCNNHWKFC
ncbi:transcription elongation factor S-II [Marchantia polymorpha subsp. ruderalis]|uniref:Transcription elongation factor n=2 Tax=Marchantia polymorpha TaxID=3197 RepID=A0AAF6BYH6_MARPO|nr:hypothetical protein MARPO_0003s0175 [Marchantia polymorpha]BBN17060.1 hypothetical protein Mp_7g11630 [Marchantia polymorpha subsp. ruderalis]|eukprot:PTQ49296.1 hypothetical protein MARPO_0003s0175 [Marchantia polymorpha]